jgi:8-amino-7-oxononanoate synthase/acyl carrier protein
LGSFFACGFPLHHRRSDDDVLEQRAERSAEGHLKWWVLLDAEEESATFNGDGGKGFCMLKKPAPDLIDQGSSVLDIRPIVSPFDPPRSHLVDSLRYWARLTPDAVAYYFTDGEGGPDQQITFAELDQAARAVAVEILQHAKVGDRGLLIYPPCLEFVTGFFGTLYAGCTAVPAFPPRRNRKGARLTGIADDCSARFALTVESVRKQVEGESQLPGQMAEVKLIATERVDRQIALRFQEVPVDSRFPAVLQYTSGSTGTPKGVVLSHSSLIRNCELIGVAFDLNTELVGCSWLPAYHDMGLVGGILAPLFVGRPCVLMSPMAFLQNPVRWLRTITRYKVNVSGGPNFAYQLCVDKVTDEEMEGLDLKSWRVAFNGAEPVRASTLEQFSEKFGRVGFRHGAHLPCYGMAETTLIVSGGPKETRPVIQYFHSRQLDARKVVVVEPSHPEARALTGCGAILPGERVEIVDPKTLKIAAPGAIGEVWIQSPSVGDGYWDKAAETKETFHAYTVEQEGPFLRTGDLGFFHQDQLFIAGRVKDLIIVRGVNRYPQDIELTVEECHESIPSCAAAAFADVSGTREKLILAVEVQRSLEDDWEPVIQTIRRVVTQIHELPPDAVYLVRYGSLPKTSSGKIQRHACLRDYQEGNLRVVAKWESWDQGFEEAAPMIAASTIEPKQSAGDDARRRVVGKKQRDPDPEVVELVKRAIRAVAQERAKQLDLDTNIVLDLGLDSIERLQIAHTLENAFGGRFPEEVLQEIETVREVADALVQHFGKHRMRVDMSFDESNEEAVGHEVVAEDYRFDQLPEYKRLKQTMAQFEMSGLPNPYFSVHEGLTRDTTIIAGRELLSFASYNYLGMSGDPRVTESVAAAARKYGTSVSASRLVSGEKDLHRALEQSIAKWIGVEDAIVLVGGHATNESVIGHIVGPGDLILHDALSHNSIVQGAILSGARRRPFPHNDWQALEGMLEQLRRRHRRVLVIVEGVYSMDGDYPDLPRFVEVVKKHHAWLMVDEAHSIGTMGKTGRGISEHFGVNPTDVDIWMGTLSKSFGSCGGYIAAKHELIELLKYTTPGFVFSVGLSPPNAAAALESLRVLQDEPQRVTKLRENAALFLNEARSRGLNTGASQDTPVVPVITGNSLLALKLSRRMYESGVNVQPILYPAVEESAARLRFFINCTHNQDQIRYAVHKAADHLQDIAPELFS